MIFKLHLLGAADEGLSQNLTTEVADLETYDFGSNKFDVIASFFAHTPPMIRARVHACVAASLRPGLFSSVSLHM